MAHTARRRGRRPHGDTGRMEGQLFAPDDGPPRTRTGVPAREAPLAVRMRPRTVDEVVGQQHLLGEGTRAAPRDRRGAAALDDPLRAAGHRQDDARAARRGAAHAAFEELSAVEAGRAEVRKVIERAAHRRKATRRADDLLPRRDPPLQQGPAGHAAAGRRGGPRDAHRGDDREPVLRGQLRAAVAQRRSTSCKALRRRGRRAAAAPRARARRAARRERRRRRARVPRRPRRRRRAHGARGARARGATARRRRASRSSGAEDALQRHAVRYDKGGDQHYDTSRPGSRPAARRIPTPRLYYLAVMLEGGEDPRFIVRRMVIFASEDIGNADPQALVDRDRGGRRGRARRPARVRVPRSRRRRSTSRSRRSPRPRRRRSGPRASTSASTARRRRRRALRSSGYAAAAKLGRGRRLRRPARAIPATSPSQDVMPEEVGGTRF